MHRCNTSRIGARKASHGDRFAHTAPTQAILVIFDIWDKLLILLGERAGDRTQDPVIKSHVLYHLSYALA
jgi:hypothetical protein